MELKWHLDQNNAALNHLKSTNESRRTTLVSRWAEVTPIWKTQTFLLLCTGLRLYDPSISHEIPSVPLKVPPSIFIQHATYSSQTKTKVTWTRLWWSMWGRKQQREANSAAALGERPPMCPDVSARHKASSPQRSCSWLSHCGKVAHNVLSEWRFTHASKASEGKSF